MARPKSNVLKKQLITNINSTLITYAKLRSASEGISTSETVQMALIEYNKYMESQDRRSLPMLVTIKRPSIRKRATLKIKNDVLTDTKSNAKWLGVGINDVVEMALLRFFKDNLIDITSKLKKFEETLRRKKSIEK